MKEEIKEELKEEKNNKSKKEDKKYEKLKEEFEKLSSENIELKDKNMRITADMINTVRRKDEELSRMLKYASEDIIKELLEVVDNFERALSMDDDNKEDEVSKFLKGFEMIYKSILNILEKNEVKEIEALGKEFDPSVHQAVLTDHKDDAKENEVIEVMQKGYTYKGKVIRPAMVKVNQ